MKFIVCENYDEMSKEAAKIVVQQLKTKEDSILGLATGSTPVGLYKELISSYEKGEISFEKVKSFNLDEYYPIKKTSDQSYYYFMNDNLFSHVNIKPENTDIPNGEAGDPEVECAAYDKRVSESAGVDIQILGIGQNGHIGFNEPDDKLDCSTHLTKLTQNTIEANSRFFEKIEDVPTAALTMGIGTIMKAKKIILLASGANKKDAVNALKDSYLNCNIPATMLKLHDDVIVICDKDAYGE